MIKDDYITIDEASTIPKYKQIINGIKKGIRDELLFVGDKIMSINHLSKTHSLSRDTVKKAYNALLDQKIIISVRGKGYYITETDLSIEVRVLFVINKLSSYKTQVFNSFVEELNKTKIKVDLEIYYCDPLILKKILTSNQSKYDYYVIVPHFKNDRFQYIDCPRDLLNVIKQIPANKLILLDRDIKNTSDNIGRIYQDFEADIYNALTRIEDQLKNYKKILLIYPKKVVYPYPKEIVTGFRKFCKSINVECEVIPKIFDRTDFKSKNLYITLQEEDLINLINQLRKSSYKMGEDIGIISYNDTPLKELLGISVISTNFKKLGISAAQMILTRKLFSQQNEFNFIDRQSA